MTADAAVHGIREVDPSGSIGLLSAGCSSRQRLVSGFTGSGRALHAIAFRFRGHGGASVRCRFPRHTAKHEAKHRHMQGYVRCHNKWHVEWNEGRKDRQQEAQAAGDVQNA